MVVAQEVLGAVDVHLLQQLQREAVGALLQDATGHGRNPFRRELYGAVLDVDGRSVLLQARHKYRDDELLLSLSPLVDRRPHINRIIGPA